MNLKVNWGHAWATALMVAGGVDGYLASAQGASVAQWMHISAGALGMAGFVIALLSKSMMQPPTKVDTQNQIGGAS